MKVLFMSYNQTNFRMLVVGKYMLLKNKIAGISLVVQWLRIRLPRQGTRVQSQVQEDPTCGGATKPVHHSY